MERKKSLKKPLLEEHKAENKKAEEQKTVVAIVTLNIYY
jgi:hypothetical protein